MVIGFVHPQCTVASENPVDTAGTGALDALEQIGEEVPSEGFKNEMNMIGHGNPGMQAESDTVKTQKTVPHYPPNIRSRQYARSVSSIEPVFQALPKAIIIFPPFRFCPGFGMIEHPDIALGFPCGQFFPRQRVGQSEVDPVNSILLGPVW